MSKFITIIRPDFMLFCGDACRAAAFNHLLFRIAGKSKDAPQEKIISGDILWYAKNEQIVEEMSNAWGLCKVRQEVNQLIKIGLIGRKNNPEWGADRTKHFCFGELQCRKFLEFCEMHQICVVHLKLSPEVMHLIYSSNANDKSIKCICSIHQMELIDISNANDESIGAIPIELPTIDDYKEEDTLASASVTWRTRDANAPIDFKTASGKIKAVALSDSHMDIGNDEIEDVEDTAKVPVVKIGGTREDQRRLSSATSKLDNVILHGDASSHRDSAHNDLLSVTQEIASQQKPDAGSLTSVANPPVGGQDDASVQASRSSGLVVTPAQRSGSSPPDISVRPATVQVAAFKPPKRPPYKKPLTMEKAQLTLEGANVKQWYEEVRGVRVRMIDKNIKDCNALAECDGMALDSLKATIEHLDKLKWVIEHDYAIDLHILAGDNQLNFENNWPLVKRKLAFKAKQEERDNGDYTDFDIYVGNGPEERAALIAQYEVRKANGTLAW